VVHQGPQDYPERQEMMDRQVAPEALDRMLLLRHYRNSLHHARPAKPRRTELLDRRVHPDHQEMLDSQEKTFMVEDKDRQAHLDHRDHQENPEAPVKLDLLDHLDNSPKEHRLLDRLAQQAHRDHPDNLEAPENLVALESLESRARQETVEHPVDQESLVALGHPEREEALAMAVPAIIVHLLALLLVTKNLPSFTVATHCSYYRGQKNSY